MTLLAGTPPGGLFALTETVPAQLEAEPFPHTETESTLRRLGTLKHEAPPATRPTRRST